MSIGTLIKTIQDIMRKDVGVDGDAQRISQIVWLLFLKIFDDKEELNFFKSSLEYNKIAELMKKFEASHSEYYNRDFLVFLKTHDTEAEIIDVTNIYY